MPAPQAKLLAQLTKTNFIAKNIKIPMQWQTPCAQFQHAFAPAELAVAPNPPTSLNFPAKALVNAESFMYFMEDGFNEI